MIGLDEIENERLARARRETTTYHNLYYSRHQLFDERSWLAKPDNGLMVLLEDELIPSVASSRSSDKLRILDLGCGVGRNAVPMAMALDRAGIKAEILGVDVLADSVAILAANCAKYGVAHLVSGLVADNDKFNIQSGSYDLIAAISVVEHCAGKARAQQLLQNISGGLKPGGLAKIEITTDRSVIDLVTGQPVDTDVETPLTETEVKDLLAQSFCGADLIAQEVFMYEELLEKDGKLIRWRSKQVSFSARQRAGKHCGKDRSGTA